MTTYLQTIAGSVTIAFLLLFSPQFAQSQTINATMSDSLIGDKEYPGIVTEGDTLLLKVVIENTGTSAAKGVTFSSTLDVNTTLILGSVSDNIPTGVQARLDFGESPLSLFLSGTPLDSLYGKTYQCGLIFHLNTTTGAGLVAAPADHATPMRWYNGSFTTTGATATGVGSGQANTTAIITNQGTPNNTSHYAAWVCDTLTSGGCIDWFLPSKDELNLMWLNLHRFGCATSPPQTGACPTALGGFASERYWSSSEINSSGAWTQIFGANFGGNQNGINKGGTFGVRAVRAFTPTVQERLDCGQTPKEIYDSGMPLDSLYGKTYQCGLIFHLNTGTGAGLVAAPADHATPMRWYNGSFTVTGATGIAVGTGQANTTAIIANQGSPNDPTHYAAWVCDTLTAGGCSDWFLPSKDALNLMWLNLADSDGNGSNTGPADPGNLGGFASDSYWSSAEGTTNGAWIQAFNAGFQIVFNKNFIFRVRAVRAFAGPTVQQRLDGGETPKQIFDSGMPLDSLYGKTYACGLIFHLNTTTGAGLVAAPTDQSTGTDWGCFGTLIPGADGTGIGTGAQNTIDIEAGCTTPGTAADICANLSLGGCNDWFLPSKDELNLMWLNLADSDGGGSNSGPGDPGNLGGFASVFYWSSTENLGDYAWTQNFLIGFQIDLFTKGNDARVRAVRAF